MGIMVERLEEMGAAQREAATYAQSLLDLLRTDPADDAAVRETLDLLGDALDRAGLSSFTVK